MTQLLPNQRLRRVDVIHARWQGAKVKAGIVFAAVMLAAALLPGAAALAQTNAPIPMPRPADRMPAGTLVEQAPSALEEAAPTDAVPDTAATDVASPATAAEALADVVREKQKVTLTAQVTENGMNLAEGLSWRIFETRVDATGELVLAARSDEANPTFELAPGLYAVHVSYGNAQATPTIEVPQGGLSTSIVLDAGMLRLNAAIAGEVPIPSNLVKFDIYSSETGERVLRAQNVAANDFVTLTAGTYQIVSRFGDVNAVVRTELRVEPGLLTDAVLYHHAAQISFKLASEPGGEAIADVDWTVKTASGETVFAEIGAFPVTVLAEGDYLVFAKRGDTVYNREFEVQPGQGREIEVLTTVY